MNKFIPIFALLLCLTGGADSDPKFAWGEVKNGMLVGSFRVSGKIVPLEGALNIQSARAAGRVLSILRKEGEKVSQGAPLLLVNSAECVTLEEEGRVAENKHLEELSTSVKRRSEELDLRPTHGRCELISSAAGTITKRLAEVGTAFNIGDALFHIVDTGRLTIDLEVPEKDTPRLAVGKRVSVTLPSDPGEAYIAKIDNVVPALDTVTRTSRVRLTPVAFRRIPSIDAFVTGDIETDSRESSLLVPSSALVFYQDKQWVVKQSEPKPSLVPVEVVNESDNQSAIRAPGLLKAGDKVLVKGAIYQFRKFCTGRS